MRRNRAFLAILVMAAASCTDETGLDVTDGSAVMIDGGGGRGGGGSGGGGRAGSGGGTAGAAGSSSGGAAGSSTGGAAGSSSGGAAGSSSGGAGGRAGSGGAGGQAGSGGGGSGGTGGSRDGGAADARPDGPADARPDASPDRFMCPPVCAIFCPYGNVIDDRGCATCRCNPAPVCPMAPPCTLRCAFGLKKDARGCTICECAPAPACTPAECAKLPRPDIACPPNQIDDWRCVRGDTGGCGWRLSCLPLSPPPLPACAMHRDLASCSKDMQCRWLAPGCPAGSGVPVLSVAGCYHRADIDCTSDATCGGGRTCIRRSVNPCPPNALCDACAVAVGICL